MFLWDWSSLPYVERAIYEEAYFLWVVPVIEIAPKGIYCCFTI
jgi:hypothetical protein